MPAYLLARLQWYQGLPYVAFSSAYVYSRVDEQVIQNRPAVESPLRSE